MFFFHDTATTEIYTLSLHDALPILLNAHVDYDSHFPPEYEASHTAGLRLLRVVHAARADHGPEVAGRLDRKSTRLNSSHANISYAVFCLKKKTPCHILLITLPLYHE